MSHQNDFMFILENMDKGIILFEALYDFKQTVYDFKIISANKWIKEFLSVQDDIIGKKLKSDACLNEMTVPFMMLLYKINQFGGTIETKFDSDLYSKKIKVVAFCPYLDKIVFYIENYENHILESEKKNIEQYNILENQEDAYWVIDGVDVLFINTAFKKLFGVSEDIRKSDEFLKFVDDRDYVRVFNALRDNEKNTDKNYAIEFRVKLSENVDKWILMKSFCIENESLEGSYGSAVFTDITKCKNLEKDLFRSNREVLALNKLLKKASEHVGFKELMNIMLLIINEHMNVDYLDVYIYNEESDQLDLTFYSMSPELLPYQFQTLVFLKDLISTVYRTKSCVSIIASECCESQEKTILINCGLNYINCFPINYDGKCLGVLRIANMNLDMTLRDKEFILNICNQLAVVINNTNLNKELIREYDKRKKAEKQNELIFNTSIDLIAILNTEMEFTRINPQCQKCLGWGEEEFIGRKFISFVYDEDIGDTLNHINKLASEGLFTGFEQRLICKDGSYRWITWNAQVVTENNNRLIILTGRDITINKQIEEKNRELERACQIKTINMEFFANISHEFRTPLNIILSAIQLIELSIKRNINFFPAQDRLRHFSSIKQNSYRLLRLVNNLIDTAKTDSGYLKAYPKNHDIVKLIKIITDSVSQYIGTKGIKLLFETNVLSKIIACDADMIERILLNLLSNALKYTERNGLITVIIKDMGSFIRISVRDTGVGISEDMLDLIFERFVQVDKPLSKRCEGSGIGLSLVKTLVELQNGRIYVNSILNKGSEFTFELPSVQIEQSSNKQIIEPSREERIHNIKIEFSDIYECF